MKSTAGFVLAALLSAMPAEANDMRPTDMTSDEAGMWHQVDKLEEAIKTSGQVNTDPQLNAYIRKITCNVAPDDCDKIRFYIIEAPVLNASMYPNGMMIVNSGLLLRAENEAQVACVVGHEYGHFIEKHSIERWRKTKSSANVMMAMSLIGGGGGQLLGALIAANTLSEFSQEHERDSDLIGFDTVAANGYSTGECADVWTNTISELESSEFKKVRKRGAKQTLFSSHPVPTERAEYLEAAALENPGGDKTGADTHKAVTARYFEAWLRAELLAKDFERHIHLFEELKSRGRNPAVLDYYIGEAYRLRKGEGDRERALEAWEASSKQAGAPAEVWRALGEQYRRKKRKADALAAYQNYLTLAPQAEDRELIQAYVARLNRG